MTVFIRISTHGDQSHNSNNIDNRVPQLPLTHSELLGVLMGVNVRLTGQSGCPCVTTVLNVSKDQPNNTYYLVVCVL